ncbi:MAG: POT-type proton-dependent oligopeptide transporter [Planctomycetota bacterium]|jgi:POT family proton-dependent oligopeptide transporter
MGKKEYLTAPEVSTKMPGSAPYILSNEAFERFAFYGARCILAIFMTQYLLGRGEALDVMTEPQSRMWVHVFVAITYFMTIIGALLSDIWLGKYKTIIIFNIVYCLGFLCLALDITRLGFFAGLILVAIGSGVVKPCVSANVGDQFGKTNKHLMSRLYGWFYFSINVGAVISTWLVPLVLKYKGAKVAFAVPMVFMFLATITYILGRKKFVHIPARGLYAVQKDINEPALFSLGKLCILFVFVIPFWAIFDQMDSSWVLLVEKMDRNIDLGFVSFNIESSQATLLNPLLVLIFIPFFSYIVYPLINKVFPLTELRKISLGLFLAITVFVVPALVQHQVSAGTQVNFIWMVPAYILLTAAEVMVSITCLEFAYTQAPKTIKSFVTSAFLLSISLGNAFAALVNKLIQNPDGTSKLPGASYFWFFVTVMLVTAVLFVFVAAFYKEKTYIQDEE